MEQVTNFMSKYLSILPASVRWEDILEIIIISFLVYQIILWIKRTKAWSLLKGLLVIMVFILLAAVFRMNTIIWLAKNVLSLAVVGIVVVLQPELRRALEQLGRKNILSAILSFDSSKGSSGRFSDRTIHEIVKACIEMSRVGTGALIVVEQNNSLYEYERTGIEVDGVVSSQLLINIFEHNTPLHDGAVIIKGNRITSATCYLPLSDSMALGKELGTRHRAGVGISEVTDSLTVIVSEETRRISVAFEGDLIRNISTDELSQKLEVIQNKTREEKKKRLWKGRSNHERQDNK